MNERIRKLRKLLNLTQQEFADRIGTKRNTIANYETGRNTPIDAIIVSICREYNVNETWLKTGEGEMFTQATDAKSTESLNDRIKQIRKNAKLTQAEFGERIGVKGNTVTNYENKLRNPSATIILTICREFNINEFWLRTGEGDMSAKTTMDTQMITRLHERLRLLRKTMDLTQQEFADKLGISRGNIASYEVSKSSPSDAVISLICREFNVNGEWLRNGKGEMFTQITTDDQVSSFVGRTLLTKPETAKQRMILALDTMSDAECDILEKILSKFLEKNE